MKIILLYFFLALKICFLTACQSAPKNVIPIDSSVNLTSEVATSRHDLNLEKSNHLNLLSPEKFKKAESSLSDSEKYLAHQGSSDSIRKMLSLSRAWLEEARQTAQKTRPLMTEALTARDNAASIAEANNKEIDLADKEFKYLMNNYESGKSLDQKNISLLTGNYLKAEKMRTERARLNPIFERIEKAEAMKAKKLAPQTYERAYLDYQAAKRTFDINPYDRRQVLSRLIQADASSQKLLEVSAETQATAKKTLEQIVLAERARQFSEKMKAEQLTQKYENSLEGTAQAHLENERLQKEAQKLEKKAEPQWVLENLRHQIPEDQADIMMSPNGTIMLRIKDLQFNSGSSQLSDKAGAVLDNIKNALSGVNAKKIIVEGHTDSTGSEVKNKLVSTHRAESVASYLRNEAQLNSLDITATGVGSERPLKNNKTLQGRAENRRVEIIIQNLL